MDKNQIRENYNKLSSYLEEVSALRGVSYLLDWDQQVVMPSKSSTFRGKQLSAIAGILHEKQTNPDIGRLIDTLQNITDDSLDKWEKANVRDAKRNFDKATKIPKELAQREATLLSKGYETWINAKKENNFSQFVPVLKDWVSLRKEQAKYIDASKDPYDVLLDNYERGLNIEQINKVFDQVKSGLIPLIEKIKTKPSPNKEFLKDKKYDVDVQVKLNHQIAKDLGFDLESGRLDVSAHPFTSEIHATDVRMTTRYKDNDLMEGISGTVHETGHALYEQGRNKDYSDQPVSSALSMGIHESQSLTWERMVGLSLSFWKRYGPKVLEAFPQIGSNITAEQFYVAVNEVRPSLIRVEADEVTYPLHIVLRTELERGLIEGTIAVEDLPKLWNERMEKYLGVVPPTDAEGVLQDVHWATGAFGYFPTYLLGAIYASQFFAQAEKELPELYESIEAGNFVPLREWLREKIHSKGSLLPSGDELVKEVTGETLNPKVFLNHLTTKYSKLYNL